MVSDSQSDIAALVTELWQKILRRKDFDSDGNFFLLGGDSMSAALLIQLLWEETHLEITFGDLYEHANLKDMQAFVTRELNKRKMKG